MAERMAPNTEDRETRGFFEAAAEDRLVYRACNCCNGAIHPPTAHCPHCGGSDTDWRQASGQGALHAWTTVTHQVHPAYAAPYTILVVELEDAPAVRLLSRIDGAPQLEAGMPMQVWFETLSNGAKLPQWKPR